MARRFVNTSSQYLNGNDAGLPTGTNEVSISIWVKTTQDVTNGNQYAIVNFGTPGTIGQLFAISYVYYHPSHGFTVTQWGDSMAGVNGANDGNWHHLCARRTGTTYYLDIDGVNVSSKSMTTNTTLSGSLNVGRIPSIPTYYNGEIAEIGIWSINLDASEVSALAKAYIPPFVRPSSLLRYYPLGGHYGQSDLDRWKNSYNLTANGSPTWTDHPRTIYQSGTRNNFTPFPDYTTLLDVIHPTNYYTIDSNYPFLSVRNNREMLLFSSTVQQTACFSRIMPSTYTGNGCHVYLYVAASTDVASTQNATFSFDVAFERVGNRVQPIDSNNFSSNKNRYYEQVPEICGYIKCIKIPFTASQMSSIQAGEMYTLRVQRAVSFDNAVGNAELYAVEIRSS